MSQSFDEWLGVMPEIDDAIQEGRGVAGSVVGRPYSLYRLGATTNQSVTNGTPLYTNYPAKLKRTTRKIDIENATFDLVVFEAVCDNRVLQLQDVLKEAAYGPEPSTYYTFVQSRPLEPTLWVRTEAAINITRPMPAGGRASQQPSSGITAAPGYIGVKKAGEQILVLQNGLYEYTDGPGSPATVMCGLQPLNRIRDGSSLKVPTSLYREHFIAYVPLLPGETLNELDRLSFPSTGDRYEVALVFTTEDVGVSGYVCIAEKLAT